MRQKSQVTDGKRDVWHQENTKKTSGKTPKNLVTPYLKATVH